MFNNTKIAFISKSDKDLKRAYFLFKTLSNTFLSKAGTLLTNIAISIKFPINWIIKPTIYEHFVGGESIEECSKTVGLLEKYKVRAILDYSVEGKESSADIQKALDETIMSIKNAGKDKNIPFAVFKPTAFARAAILERASLTDHLNSEEKEEAENFRKRVNILCQTAFDSDIPILIDAEDSWFQNFVDEVVTEMMEKFNKEKAIVFNTLQMYRHDRLEFLKTSLQKSIEGNYFLGMKFVRGAYMEKERLRAEKMNYSDPIQPNKEATDNDYNAALKFSIENIDRISIFNGTHNEKSSKYLCELMQEHSLQKNDKRIYFAQLYGMSDHISFNSADAGYNVAKYVPYGPVKFVMPYLLRRAEENTSVAGQTSIELELLQTEMQRRKNLKK
ncbi:MAG: proline dehydrogenase [Bacteroidetes bacterium]|jgi:proline dehydrogenase|nr:proline dehydrogenase [Bacteroidota bacterium]MBT6687896.1 proline dehydrogenase [Bacteroidota bacterium]MBT7142456.1 proline dehydrogenase [Bacteroidota bacterium]MBT7490037.1 proline dehydrogenase [Bacteroidota bacterium]